MASSEADREAAFRLRFRVFNLELNEGSDTAFSSGFDTDEFDSYCEHLIVRDQRTGAVVGTYRMQEGSAAARHIGYYSAREFDFSPYEALRHRVIELGRACIHPNHRTGEVLMLLWKGIARYAASRGARYLIGCSSLSTQDLRFGSAIYRKLLPKLAEENLRTAPTPAFSFPLIDADDDVKPPKLLRTYLALGARICGPPALDREFKTIDFLTLLDLDELSPSLRSRMLLSR